MLYGHVETAEQRVDHLEKLRGLQDETGGFTGFIPFAFEPSQTRLAELGKIRRASALEELRVIAASRLILDNNIKKIEDNVYYCQDIDSGYYNKAITLETFKEMDIDYVIASLPQHIEPFKKLAEMKGCPLIFQVGNQWDGIYCENILASARLTNVPVDINYVEYHQEFDTKIFKPAGYTPYTITSLMNIPEQMPDYQTLLTIEKELGWKVNI